ncbi:MAG: nucleotide pyrophosphohydrolase [Syntrophorhabdus aromaticivorans]|uniref:Nucleotide pyrophosphohydrolase n=1 Tax=Syntrophorhabdus aromaticivorans TaxID=328301 RepID=A0A971M5S3_9BACT|nr:nucleotide pyrophosphohydrolase [Syntrophorhabdus aromaticivorans]
MRDLDALSQLVQSFCDDRDWGQYHNPKDLAIGVSTEANELLDLFRFKSDIDMRNMMTDPLQRKAIGQELADVFYFLLRFSQLYSFDLDIELHKKMFQNNEKYPLEKSKGKNKKYNEIS